jgi:hypothetical protein
MGSGHRAHLGRSGIAGPPGRRDHGPRQSPTVRFSGGSWAASA